MQASGVGVLLKDWRSRRHLSQMALAFEAGVSPKHLSFVETGRSRPSPELILTLARHLDVPLRERNDLLLAAGFAPRFTETPLSDPSMEVIVSSLTRLLDAHDPYPGLVLDRRWNVVLSNRAALLIAGLLPPELAAPPLNIFRISLHPDGLAPLTTNFPAWADHLLSTLRRAVVLTGDPNLAELEAEVQAYPNVAALAPSTDRSRPDVAPALLIPFELRVGDVDLSMFTTLTTFGTPRDVTLDDLAVELFYPADDRTESFFIAATAASVDDDRGSVPDRSTEEST